MDLFVPMYIYHLKFEDFVFKALNQFFPFYVFPIFQIFLYLLFRILAIFHPAPFDSNSNLIQFLVK